MTGIFGTEAGYHALMKCDTLLLLGCDFAWRQFYPSSAKIIQIDIAGSASAVSAAGAAQYARSKHSLAQRDRSIPLSDGLVSILLA
jgi:thiamine pyrophosphate-dependent acetolactate synthase large subunit-like protein